MDSSTLISNDATREILLFHTASDCMGLCISAILLRALSSLRRSGEVLPGLPLIVWLMLISELLRAAGLGFSWFSKPAPLLFDLISFTTGFIVLVGVPITFSARYLPKQDLASEAPKPWLWLQRAMIATAVVGLGVLLAAIALRQRAAILLGPAAAYTLTAVLLLSRVLLYRHLQVRRRPLLLFVAFMVTGLFVLSFVGAFSATMHIRIRQSFALASLNGFGLISVLCGIVFLFANVRLADVIVKRSLRIVLGSCASLLSWFLIMHSEAATRKAGTSNQDVTCLLLVCGGIALSPMVERGLNRWIDGWVFEQPDLQAAVATFWARLLGLEHRDEALTSTETFLRELLNLTAVRVKTLEAAGASIDLHTSRPGAQSVPRARRTAHVPHPPADIVVPIFVDGQADYAITLIQGAVRPPLTQWEMDFVERIAGRLQIWLGMRRATERAQREASLKEELTSAELRALRAQVNPHFLFNSLNTIADLAVIAPEQAEEMTIRLSSVFRYVLVNTDRQFTSLDEELEFTRSYLHIEQTRFGDRLKVEFDIDPSTLGQQIPTLLLQPLVENALKHGIAPRREGGTLIISTRNEDKATLLSVADDGVGLREPRSPAGLSTRVGVENVMSRLRTAYGEQGSFTLRARQERGTEALIRIPRG